jgi:phytoene/squalene synthetase
VHPITRSLLACAGVQRIDWMPLRGLIEAARMELARVTFETEEELQAYLQASGGTLHRVCAQLALAPASAGTTCDALGRALRRCEIVDTLHRDARLGFIALPLAWLDQAGVPVTALQEPRDSEALRRVFERFASSARSELADALGAIDRPARRRIAGQFALAAGYTRTLAARRRQGWRLLDPPPSQHPFGTLWTIWRAVRRLELDVE